MVPVAPVFALVISEKEVAVTLRVRIDRGDLSERIDLPGRNRLTLIVSRGQARFDLTSSDGWWRDGLGDLEGISAKFLNFQREVKT